MLVRLSSETIKSYADVKKSTSKIEKTFLEMRDVQLSILRDRGITKYVSFLKLMKAVAPLEDEIEIFRFYHGHFFSEYFVLFISRLLESVDFIDLSPFQDKIPCKCPTCGNPTLKAKKNGKSN